MRQLMMLLAICSLSACASIERPDAYVCGFNAKSEPMKLRCYHIKRDFLEDGTRKKSAKPKEIEVPSCHSLNGYIMQSPADWEKSLVWVKQMRQAYEDLKKSCGK